MTYGTSNQAQLTFWSGGTPCQSFSVAGKRGGLTDPRGQLMFSYLGVAERLRPRWVVWENVPGVLSSGGGRDFGSFLGALGQLGYGWAYRVIDAQWCRVDGYPHAVPQQRRRVFVVGCLGDGRRAAEVLFESQSVCRDSEAYKTTRRASTSTPQRDAACGDVSFYVGTRRRYGPTMETYVAFHPTQDPISRDDGSTHALGVGGAGGTASVAIATPKHVRRLTPLECERLQAFPDGYTDIKPGGKPTPDGPRYKALGNSMAVNCMRWIGSRIEVVKS